MADLRVRTESIQETPSRFRLETDPGWWEAARAELRERDALLEGPFFAEFEAYRLGQRLLFRGRVGGEIALGCSRCARPVHTGFDEPLELLLEPAQNPAGIPEGGIELDAEDFELGRYAGDELDFGPVILEILALAWPMQPLCSEACLGLCPSCGAERIRQSCGCGTGQPNRPFADLGRKLAESQRKPRR